MLYRSVSFLPRLRDSFWRHRWLFLLSVVTVSGITTLALALRKPTFHASAATQVISDSEELADALGQQERFSYVTPSQQQTNHLSDLLNDDRPDGFLDTALRTARLAHPINIDPRAKDPRAARLRKSLTVTADSGTLFSLALTWDDATECERLLLALQAQYIAEVGFDRQAKSVGTTKFLDSQLADYRQKMQQSENALRDYKKNNAGELPEAQTADIQQLESLQIQRDSLSVSSQDSAMKRAAIQHRMNNLPKMSILEQTVVAGPEQQSLRDLMTRRSTLLSQGYKETSDEIVNIEIEIQSIQHLATQEAAAAAAGGGGGGNNIVQTKQQNNPEYETLSQQLTDATIAETTQTAQLQNINQKITEYEAKIAKIPDAQRELTDKTRDYNIFKAEYDRLQGQRNQADMKAKLDQITATSTLIPVGTVYAEPTTPRSKQLLMFAGSIILGLLVGVVVVILSEWGDTTLRYGSDAERILELPVLVEVPELRRGLLAARSGLPGSSTPSIPSAPIAAGG